MNFYSYAHIYVSVIYMFYATHIFCHLFYWFSNMFLFKSLMPQHRSMPVYALLHCNWNLLYSDKNIQVSSVWFCDCHRLIFLNNRWPQKLPYICYSVKWIGIPGFCSFHRQEFFSLSTWPHWLWNPPSLSFYMFQGFNFSCFCSDCWSTDRFILVSTPFCRCVFHVSEEHTAFIRRMTEYDSGGCWHGWENEMCVISHITHIFLSSQPLWLTPEPDSVTLNMEALHFSEMSSTHLWNCI